MITIAIVRPPGHNAAKGQTTQSGPSLHLQRLREQHRLYCETLAALDIALVYLETEPGFPDGYFVEDTAVVTPEVAVVSRPGAPPRRGEEHAVAGVLANFRPLVRIESPGTLDGGDVLIVERQVFIGLSSRTNRHGAEQLTRILSAYGYQCTTMTVDDGLHLKSSVNHIGDGQLLMAASWAKRPAFAGYEKTLVISSEAHACNTLWLNDHLIMPAGYPDTLARLEATGKPIIQLETGEIRRMDGGLTCLSIRL